MGRSPFVPEFFPAVIQVNGPYRDSDLQGINRGKFLGRICRVELARIPEMPCPHRNRGPQSSNFNKVHLVYADEAGDELEVKGEIVTDDLTVVDVWIRDVPVTTSNFDTGELGFYFCNRDKNAAAYAEVVCDRDGYHYLIVSPNNADMEE